MWIVHHHPHTRTHMNRLAIQLKSAVESSGLTRAQICEQCGLEPAALSKYLAGKMHPRKNVLSRLIKIIPQDLIGQVYAAYIMDSLPEEANAYVSVRSTEKSKLPKKDSRKYNAPPLPKDLEEAFDYLRSMAGKSPVVADSILSTYKMMKSLDLKMP